MTARILVVDDIAANLRLLEIKLLNEYYEVAIAASGPEALTTVQRWMPDVVLLDVMMPGMDGYEVCRRLKAQPGTAHIPVVMITALTDPVERVRGLEAGADDFLSKPVDDATLFARLRALLRMKQVLDAWRLRAETARDLGFEPPPGPSPSVAGARALIVNEDAAEAEALAQVLGADGIEVAHCAEPTEAWDLLQEGLHDVVLLSLSLDGGDSLRLASRLRAHASTRDVPVLLVADPGQKGLVLRGFDLGANDHVIRPVDPNELRARVRNQIRRKRYQERLRADLDRSLEMAVTDPLTGLRNRRYVRRHLEGVLRNSGAAVLLMDVDRFKAVNDTYGHASGDVVLREVAERVRGHLRAADVVARYGGEEFLVVMSGAATEDGMLVAERLRAAIANVPVVAEGIPLTITMSIGVAAGGIGAQADDVISAADAALYRGKNNGRNRVEAALKSDWPPAADQGKPAARSAR
ncbi:PleD family two-component system response regulator [Falsiroseomonas selenitidurans]|uniref:diguanylate cyclase n=1 Tax=Falsiroseomonas selenitidurans TaxID=2716335 RepID=A0ABX1E782_9PROT|nr:PleD family two-component system response regulator [Falsiroseomonas selenitidurans]NKC32796.1 PleD family two-component system response regulator [Falsiroseomonas selenitidurans]